MSNEDFNVLPSVSAIIEAYLDDRANVADVIAFLQAYEKQDEVTANFREILEIELIVSVDQVNSLLEKHANLRATTGDDTVVLNQDEHQRDISLGKVIEKVTSNYERLVRLYAELVSASVDTEEPFHYATLPYEDINIPFDESES